MKTNPKTPPPAAMVLLCVGLLLSIVIAARAWHSYADGPDADLPLLTAR